MATSKILINKVAESEIPAASGEDTGVDNLYFTDEHSTYITDKTGNPILVGTGDYEKLTNKPIIPDPYELPTASDSVLGGVKVGNNLTIDEDGVLSSIAVATSVSATADVTSGTKIGTITVDEVGTDLYTPTEVAVASTEPADKNTLVWINNGTFADNDFGGKNLAKINNNSTFENLISGGIALERSDW